MRELAGRRVCSVACGTRHFAACTEQGALLTWGVPDDGRLGRDVDLGPPGTVCAVPRRVEFPNPHSARVVQVACGGARTFALTRDGALYAVGQRGPGLGLGFERAAKQDVWRPELVERAARSTGSGALTQSGAAWVRIAACETHVLACDADGVVYSWGRAGCVGRDDDADAWLPEPVALWGGRVVSIACGFERSVLVVSSGVVYGCGKGALPHGESGAVPLTVDSVRLASPASDVSCACGDDFSVVTDPQANGVWVWGSSSSITDKSDADAKLVVVPTGPAKVRGAFAAPHAVGVVCTDGSVFAWGQSGAWFSGGSVSSNAPTRLCSRGVADDGIPGVLTGAAGPAGALLVSASYVHATAFSSSDAWDAAAASSSSSLLRMSTTTSSTTLAESLSCGVVVPAVTGAAASSSAAAVPPSRESCSVS